MTNPKIDALINKFHNEQWRQLAEDTLQQTKEHARQWRLALEAADRRALDATLNGFLRGITVASALWAAAVLLVHL